VILFKDLFNLINVVHYLTLKLKVLPMWTIRAINWQSRMRSSCLLCVFIRSRICISRFLQNLVTWLKQISREWLTLARVASRQKYV